MAIETSQIVLTVPEREALQLFRVEVHGIWPACALLGVSRGTYERAVGGLAIRRGSAALIRAALARLAEGREQV